MPPVLTARRSGPHWYWWVLWLIVLAIIAFFVWVWGWGPATGPANARVQPVAAPVTDYLAIVNAPNRAALAGRRADLGNLTVQEVVNGGVFWAGEKGREVLIVGASTPLQPGAHVHVEGVIRAVPPDVEQRWNLTPGQATQAQAAGLYVQADRIAK